MAANRTSRAGAEHEQSRRWLLGLIAGGGAALATGVVAGPGTIRAAQPGGRASIEPGAGTWRTWLLTTGGQLRPAPPPDGAATAAELAEVRTLTQGRNAAAPDRVRYWDAGSPGYRWLQILFNRSLKLPANPAIARQTAYLTTAVYDATIAAWESKYTYNRPRPAETDPSLATALPAQGSPSYPSEHAAAAGAAAAVLTHFYPSEAATFAELADEAGRSRVLAGVHFPSDVRAGLELGRAVGALAVERALADGFDRAAAPVVAPSGPGVFTSMNPVLPGLGAVKPWVLTSADQFRPSPPPAHDSAQKAAELAEIKGFERTFATNQKALTAQTPPNIFGDWYEIAGRLLFEEKLDGNAPRSARAYALMAVAHIDAGIACWDAKYHYWAARPVQLDPAVTTLFPTPGHPSYPAAHGSLSGAIGAAMGYVFPGEAERIAALAEENGMSRLWAGIHFRSDIEVGLAQGRRVAQAVIERARTDGA